MKDIEPRPITGLLNGVHISSLDTINKGRYLIKASSTQFDTICFVILDSYNLNTSIKFFSDDIDAYNYFMSIEE